MPVVSVGNASVSPEGDSGTKPASFAVTLSQATTVPVTVAYATADATATQPADYAAASGSLTFAPGETAKSVAVDVKGDLLEEPNETFALSLSNPAGATLGTAQGTGTIVDDDADAPSNDPPGSVDPNGLFCGRQHRGKCRGIKFKAEFDRPGNAVWSFAAYNANPGGSATAAASADQARQGREDDPARRHLLRALQAARREGGSAAQAGQARALPRPAREPGLHHPGGQAVRRRPERRD